MGKRKEDRRRDDSSSSSSSSSSSFDAKRRRPRRDTSRPKDGKIALIQIKDAIQDKENTEAKFNRKIAKLKEKRKKDKIDLGILKRQVERLVENVKILKEGHEYLKSKIQEMQKEGCAEVDHYRASPSKRSQLSQSTRFRLVIENSVRETIYKNETVETEDGGGRIKVIMHDGDTPIAPDHPLASVKVDLVVIEGWFNDKRDSWSKEEFEKSIITPREGMIRLVKNGSFNLIGGSCDHQGAIIMDNSRKREVKLGVKIAVHRKERVLEGVSNPFKVQEGKTKRSQKKGKQPSPPVPTPILGQSTSAFSTQHGQALNGNGQDFSQLPPALMWGQSTSANPMHHGQAQDDKGENILGKLKLLTAGPSTNANPMQHGQALNGNGQDFSELPPAPMWGQSTSANPMQHVQARDDKGENILGKLKSLTAGPSTNANPMQHGQALNGNGQDFSQLLPAPMWGQSTSANPMQHGQARDDNGENIQWEFL